MSKTINTMPWKIQVKKRESWRNICGYPGAFGGAWPGRKAWARFRNRRFRRAASVALCAGREIPVTVRNVAYDVW